MPQSRNRSKIPESHPPKTAPAAIVELSETSPSAVVAALAGTLAAWSAAGSLGLVSDGLRHGISWLGLGVSLIAAWPGGPIRDRTRLFGLAAVVAAALLMTTSKIPVCNVLAITLVLAVLAQQAGRGRKLLAITSLATAVLAIHRLAMASIPSVWCLADAVGRAFCEVSEILSGRPLVLGETFAGLDFLVLMGALLAGWLVRTPGPRLGRAVLAAVGILLGHFSYLYIVSCAHDLMAALPEVPAVPTPSPYVPPQWEWSEALRTLLPWNLPIVGAMIHLGVAALMFRWAKWIPDPPSEDAAGADKRGKSPAQPGRLANLAEYGPAVLAGLIPLLLVLSWGGSDLKGTRIVAHEEGYLDWLKPRHGEYGRASAGMYGMLPTLVESLGGEFSRSEDLAAADLADADILLLIHPNSPWSAQQLERVWNFVRGGGSLLLAAEPAMYTGDRRSSFNQLLQPTRITVRSDTAISQIGQWEQSLLPLAHPATTGLGGGRGQFGQMMGASLDVRWPASPILVGRWGFADPGSDAVHTGVYRHDPGEKLGDLILAAEDRVGRGKVLVLSDTAALSNQVIGKSYPFIVRILAYLAGRSSNPQAGWRQTLGLLACLALVGLFFARTDCEQLATVALVLAVSVWGTRALGHRNTRVLPDGRAALPNNVAYIDASHLEAYCDEPWGDDGLDGLFLTLMRNGYLPLRASDLEADRLEKAALLISIAPARPFSGTERKTVREFVESGGVFICSVGAESAGPSEQLLADFGFGVPPTHLRAGRSHEEPEPIGCVRPVYLDSRDQQASVMLFAGWPIRQPTQGAEALAYGSDNTPVIAAGYFGEGALLLVGDSSFAMNKNLERVDGEPLFGNYDNPDFWRWVLGHLTDQPEWLPPRREPLAQPEEPAAEAERNSTDQTAADQASGGEESR